MVNALDICVIGTMLIDSKCAKYVDSKVFYIFNLVILFIYLFIFLVDQTESMTNPAI